MRPRSYTKNRQLKSFEKSNDVAFVRITIMSESAVQSVIIIRFKHRNMPRYTFQEFTYGRCDNKRTSHRLDNIECVQYLVYVG